MHKVDSIRLTEQVDICVQSLVRLLSHSASLICFIFSLSLCSIYSVSHLNLSVITVSYILNEFFALSTLAALFDIQIRIPGKVLYLSVCSTNLYVLCIIQKYISPGDTFHFAHRVRVKSSRSRSRSRFMKHILCFHDQINAMKFINLST